MRISFVLGPAGSGKTFRCLHEIRSELVAAPEGPPLIFLAPKQSTYQLERQLLDHGLLGYSRLQIVSFERFARFIFQQSGSPVPKFLSEQGRTMVLRALLTGVGDQLSIFRGAARRLGFAEEVSRQIREFQNHGLTPAALRKIAAQVKNGHSARDKLIDLALVFDRYNDWLSAQELEDGDALLAAAADLLESDRGKKNEFAGIWFDGFAQLTPQELNLLVGALRFTSRATLAFCVDAAADASSSISANHLVSHTVARCRNHIEQKYGSDVLRVDSLQRDPRTSRFSQCAALQHLERSWQSTNRFEQASEAVRVVQANDPEAEAIFVAREIIRHVRNGGRYREVALLLRDLQNDYSHVLRRVFRRYEIPHFMDHRESVAHHPQAELTRGALRSIAYNFRHDDWFATLKCGLLRAPAEELDELENEALARGWQGSVWRTGFKLPDHLASLERRLNRLRERLVEPFLAFGNSLGLHPRTEELASAIQYLWSTLKVQQQLESWSQEDAPATIHATVWEQMGTWLEDLKLAFRGQQMPLVHWLPIIEAGLKNLTVGVVPPVLDQVLIGTVDRSRNPDLKALYILGLNERIFPAAPKAERLITDDDREVLCETGCIIGDTPASRLATEHFYGYIACTRPRERLILSFARTSLDGAQLNPSRFISHVMRLFPALKVELADLPESTAAILHRSELAPLGLNHRIEEALFPINQEETLDPILAQRIFGPQLHLSVSSLERFAACPFKFFLEQGLKVRERKEFLLDVREQGSYQHDVLAKFHEELKQQGLKWRDLSPEQARSRVARIVDQLIPTFGEGLLTSSEQNRFTAEHYKSTLQDLIAVLVGWFSTNHFDPEVVEFGFGKDSPVPGWTVDLGNGFAVVLHGRVDRVDLYRLSESEALCVVMDYKSGLRKPNRTLLHHGIQQQLPAYLLMMTRVKEVAAHFQVQSISPAGCFLLPLKGRQAAKRNRREALHDSAEFKKQSYTHEGIFDVRHLEHFDSTPPPATSRQFNHRLKKSGDPYSNSFNALATADFHAILHRTEELIRETGQRIYQGDIAIHPFKLGSQTACLQCDYQSVCRFDPWSQKYRVLNDPEKSGA